MASPDVQIIALRSDGTDPRTVAPLAGFDKQITELKALEKAKDYPGAKLRPKLVLWDASGALVETPIPSSKSTDK